MPVNPCKRPDGSSGWRCGKGFCFKDKATAERVCRAYYWRKGQEEEEKAKAEEEKENK